MKKHYHVLVGLAGLYMPNSNTVCRTRREAESNAAWWAREAREQGDKVTGSAKTGYYSVGEHECIEITECDISECLEDIEQ
jgi:hypothetical protein